MKSSKERKMERKEKHKALSVEKTVKSRQRRLDNKAKRDEIHAIDPDIKIIMINEIPHKCIKRMGSNGKMQTIAGGEISLTRDGNTIRIHDIVKPATVEVFEPDPEEHKKGRAIDDQIEKERLGVLNPFRWKKKLTL